MILKIFLLIVGIGVLLTGAEFLIRGSRDVALRLGISTLIIGLTVVAFGTSAPELFVSVAAALEGTADVAVGNIIGSNIFNLFVIIGLTAVLIPVQVPYSVIRRDLPLMLLGLGGMVLSAADGVISRGEGIILFSGLLGYLLMNYLQVGSGEKKAIETYVEEHEEEAPPASGAHSFLFIVGGLIGLVIGAELIVDNAVWCARQFGVSELVIGVTLIAVGTSLPELATTALAARKGEPDLVVGNAVGSNLFNVLCVIGLTSMVQPLNVAVSAQRFDLPVMFFGSVCLLPLLYWERTIGRVLGVALLLTYGGYIAVTVSQ
ncbi:calcium/sodium antiporter [bacterium]|nr:calcium/sodium antiporter [bacterium]